MPRIIIGLCFMLACVCFACGGGKGNIENNLGGVSASDSGATSFATEPASAGPAGGDASGNNSGNTAQSPIVCGDKKKEGNEECDDGDRNENNGCTSLCTFSCHQDSDCQKDPCRGAGATCDTKNTHMCTAGSGNKADGEPCGDNKACNQGSCVEIACNNGVKQAGEECDDGDQNERNGCTTKCKYSCVTGNKDYPMCANDCDLSATCDDATHKCVAGKPLAENALCNNGAGYCKNGGCVASVCGDGIKQPNEECDEGKKNGPPGAKCMEKCKLSVCGNGIIEGKEQCDDGNTTSLDGCDSNCKIEFVNRITILATSTDPAPDFCLYSPNNPLNPNKDKTRSIGNVFAKVVSSSQDLAKVSNATISNAISSSTGSFIIQLLDVDDPTFTQSDPFIRIGLSYGIPETGSDWDNTPNRLDFPLQTWKEYYDDQLNPSVDLYAEVKIDPTSGKVVVQTTKPGSLSLITKPTQNTSNNVLLQGNSTTTIRNVMIALEVDMPRSKVTSPPENADGLKLPESSGNYTSDSADPTGVLCGALDLTILSETPVPVLKIVGLDMDIQTACDVQYNDPKIHLRSCPNGKADLDAGKCSSMLDLYKGGCDSTLLGPIFPPLGEPDADTDSDGIYDSYTMVEFISVQRVRMSTKGFATDEPPLDIVLPK